MKKFEITKPDGKLNQSLRNEIRNAYVAQLEADGWVRGANGKMFKAIAEDANTGLPVYVTTEVSISLKSPDEVAAPKKKATVKKEKEVVDLTGLFD